MLRANKDAKGASPAAQLEANKAAPASEQGAAQFAEKQSEFEINNAMRSLLSAPADRKAALSSTDEESEKPRRVLLCLGEKKDEVARLLSEEGYRVYIAQTPAQANERLREGKLRSSSSRRISPPSSVGPLSSSRRQTRCTPRSVAGLYLVSLEDGGTTMNAHDAFLRNLNLIVNTADIPQLPLILNRAVLDFNDLYHYLNRGLGVEPI
jgi:PleD family two-component response regulator